MPLTVALVKVPTLVKLDKVVNVVLLVAVIFPAVAALPVVFWFSVGKVQFAKLPEEGVPSAGVTNVGLVANTLLPDPVFVTLTNPLLASVATAEFAVRDDIVVVPLNVKLDANLAVVTEPSDGTPACDNPIDVTRINVPTVGVKPNVKLTPLTE